MWDETSRSLFDTDIGIFLFLCHTLFSNGRFIEVVKLIIVFACEIICDATKMMFPSSDGCNMCQSAGMGCYRKCIWLERLSKTSYFDVQGDRKLLLA